MEELGPEASKRPRLDAFGGAPSAHRMHQQHSESPLPLHSYQGTQALRPPSAYSQPLPPSPYDPVGEQRNPSEPVVPPPPSQQQHNYSLPHSGYNTPGRDVARPYQPDLSYSRQGSFSAPTRSPDEGQPSSALRPINTVSANEGQHYQPLPHPEAVVHPGGYVPHEGYPNGQPHGLPMSSHLDPSQRPPPPAPSLTGAYSESPASNGPLPYGVSPYGGPPPDSPWGKGIPMGARKSTRAQQACDTCRARKAKCDEGKPVCAYCREQNLPCNYKEVAPAKADRAQKEIMDQLAQLRNDSAQKEIIDQLAQLRNDSLVRNERLDRIETILEKLITNSGGSREPESPVLTRKSEKTRLPPHVGVPSPEKKPMVLLQDSSSMPQVFDQQAFDVSNSAHDGNFGSIAVDHTTGVHRLLQWATIKEMVVPRFAREDYVMETEERKGLLRVYGRGQGRDLYDGGHVGPASPATSSASGRSDEAARSPASSSSDLHGSLGLPSPPAMDARDYPHDHPGGLNLDGSLKLDKPTMYRLQSSYLKNMHIMHPFLNKTKLNRMFEKVASQANTTESGTIRSPFIAHNPILGPDGSLNKATKRKYSSGTGAGSPGEMATSNTSRGAGDQGVERRISTAIVLLVMALGKICEHKDNLPGPVPDHYRDTSSTPSGMQSVYSPRNLDSPPTNAIRTSETGYPTSSAMSSPSDPRVVGMSRRTSTEPQSGQRMERNIDIIPGFAYYARATDLLGNMHGGNDLSHVQANLLASLYASQMACAIESWSYIQTACRACYFLIRDPTLAKQQALNPTRADSIRFAYWTCLQFESDIIAELDLRRSGIGEIHVDYPKGVSEADTGLVQPTGSEETIMRLYSAQIHLRTTLNHIQSILYPPDAVNGRVPWTAKRLLKERDGWEASLQTWWDLLPTDYKWKPTDPPAEDINVARLRAKYYGTRYITYRPFLNYALHSMNNQGYIPSETGSGPSGRNVVAMGPPDPHREEILRSAKLCLEAAMHSTEAFDGVMKHSRLIVTNIFGTAHAQFGNMLVLIATQRSWLSHLLDKREVVRLLDRTIRFLSSLAPISTTLAADADILKNLKLYYYTNEPQASSSFSSTG